MFMEKDAILTYSRSDTPYYENPVTGDKDQRYVSMSTLFVSLNSTIWYT